MDGRPVGDPLPYGEVSDYRVLDRGVSRVTFRAVDGPPGAAPVATTEVVLGPGTTGSAFLSGAGQVHADVVLDDLIGPPVGQARLRFLNLAPGLPELAVRLRDGSPLAGSVPYRSSTAPVDVPAGSHDLELLEPGTGRPLLTVSGLTLQAGSVYTLVGAGGGGLPLGRTAAVVDAAGAGTPPVGGVAAGLGGAGARLGGPGAATRGPALVALVALSGAAGAALTALAGGARGTRLRPARSPS